MESMDMQSDINIEFLVDKNDIISGMMSYWEIIGVLKNLKVVLDNNIEGEIVELGCNVGTTSMYIRKLLDAYKSDKELHVYDSWEGLPAKHMKDTAHASAVVNKGACKAEKAEFITTFFTQNLKLPIIHSGWFSEISDNEYPEKICFAFFDGDFYTSIIDSFNKTFHKMQPGGMIIVDDCGWSVLPGVELACRDFLNDKKETLDLTAYPDANGVFGGTNNGGRIIKL